MKLFELLELMDSDTPVWIATRVNLENEPDAELVAEGRVDELRLVSIRGYEVVSIDTDGTGISIVVKEEDT